MAYWTVARTEPHRERFAIQMLAVRGFKETYLPLIKARRRVRNHQTTDTVPMFQNYLFLLLGDFFWDAKNCPGIARLLLDGDRPAKVPDRVIDDLRSREKHGLVVLPEPPGQFKAGDRVRIVHGPFTGLPAFYAGQSSRERVRVLLTLLGSSRPVTMQVTDIEAV
jgi:transcriptional antiterminator RfaH